jgi:hypothetical protein
MTRAILFAQRSFCHTMETTIITAFGPQETPPVLSNTLLTWSDICFIWNVCWKTTMMTF